MPRPRLVVLASHPIQYFAPLFRELAQRTSLELLVVFESDMGLVDYHDAQFGKSFRWDIPLTQGYEHVFIGRYDSRTAHGRPSPAGLVRLARLVKNADAVLLMTFLTRASLLALLTARVSGTRVLYRTESTRLLARTRREEAARVLVLRSLLSQVDVALYVGAKNREYLSHYGVSDARLVFSPYAVDNEFFLGLAEKLLPRKPELREQFGLEPELPVFLFCGKLIDKKQPLLLLEAFSRVRRELPCQLLYAGDGELRAAIEARVAADEIPNVRVTGFLNQTELPAAYAASDVLVLPSKGFETWGLVVNEAMCFGLPAIVSDRVGSGYDLIEEGVTGRVIGWDDRERLCDTLRELGSDAVKCRSWGTRARTRVMNYSPRAAADGIEAALA